MKKKSFLKILIIICLIILNCYVTFSQICFKTIESYYIDLTKTKLNKNIYQHSTVSHNIFAFFLKIEICNNAQNYTYIKSENSKFILGIDTLNFSIYSLDTNFDIIIVNDSIKIPKGKSIIYLYCHFENNKIPYNDSEIYFDNIFEVYKFKRYINKHTQILLANNSQIPYKIKIKNFKIILNKKSKEQFFYNYKKFHKFITNYNNIKKNIVLPDNNLDILNDTLFDFSQ